MVQAGTAGTIWLWEAGCASGTAGDPGGAMAAAGPYLAAGAGGLAEEAVVIVTPEGGGGLVSEHRRTGLAYRGRLQDGSPSWELVTRPEALAG